MLPPGVANMLSSFGALHTSNPINYATNRARETINFLKFEFP